MCLHIFLRPQSGQFPQTSTELCGSRENSGNHPKFSSIEALTKLKTSSVEFPGCNFLMPLFVISFACFACWFKLANTYKKEKRLAYTHWERERETSDMFIYLIQL
jgi:hypothetical protein